jgi:hypothetical protein
MSSSLVWEGSRDDGEDEVGHVFGMESPEVRKNSAGLAKASNALDGLENRLSLKACKVVASQVFSPAELGSGAGRREGGGGEVAMSVQS